MTTPNTAFQTLVQPFGPAAIADAARLILAGQPVAVPTETVYGLAADATNAAAVAAIYAAKGRPSFNPLIVHVADSAAAGAIGVFGAQARALAAAYWPGPMTLVVPLHSDAGIAALAMAGLQTVAIRVPAHRAIQALLAATGKPLAAPSANASGMISPTRASHVRASLGGRIAMIIDDGATTAGIESTIVMPGVAEGDMPRILRPGPVSLSEIEALLGVPLGDADSDIVAPGQLASHYAPAKPLRLNATRANPGEWLIGFGDVGGDDTLSASGDLIDAAARLFDCLHRADASGHAGIAVAPVPMEGIGVAINDRLARAAHRD